MAGSVTTDLVFFTGTTGGTESDCDQDTDWADTPTIDTEIFIQGLGSCSIKCSKTTVTSVFTLVAPLDLTGKMIYLWAMTLLPSILATKGAGGLQIRVEDGANWGSWYIAGNDTWAGVWKCFAQYVDTDFSFNGGTDPDRSAITKIGVTWYTTASAKITPNCYWDALRYGTFLRIQGGTEGDPATFDDLIAAEETVANRYGILERVSGVLFAQGNLEFGSPDTISTYFRDVSEVIIFQELENSLNPDFYQLKVQGNTVATTTVYFGDEVGTSGISGCAFRTSGAPKFKFLADDPNISTLGVYGCSIFDANTIRLINVYSSAYEVENTNFEAGEVIEANACKFLSVNFVSADDIAVNCPLDHNISNSQFINNPTALSVADPGTLTLDACFFSGNSIDIEFLGSAGQTLTVFKTNGADPTTTYCPNGGTVYFAPSIVDLKVYVKDEDGNNLNGIRVAIFTSPGLVELMNEETVDGLAIESFSYVSPEDITVRVRKQGYVPVNQSSQIGEAGLLVYITLSDDPVYSPT